MLSARPILKVEEVVGGIRGEAMTAAVFVCVPMFLSKLDPNTDGMECMQDSKEPVSLKKRRSAFGYAVVRRS